MNPHQQKCHIIMFPFMAQGHIIPFLALAKFITGRSPTTKITLVSTPLNIQYIHSTLSSSPQTTTNIHLAELPFSSSDHGLPPNSENTDSLPSLLISTLFFASETLQSSFHKLITNIFENEKCVPLCIISDIFTSWTIDVATSVGIPHFSFTTCGGYGTAAYFSVWSNLPHRNPSGGLNDEFHPPGFPENTLFHVSQLPIYLREADFTDPFAKFIQRQISLSLKSDGMLCNTVEEIEVFGLQILRKMMKSKPVWTIGPLLPPFLLKNTTNSSKSEIVSQLRTGKELGISIQSCIEWLDHQKQSSVLYISFGSQNTINSLQMKELALGIEESWVSFIWVLRPPKEFDIKSEFISEWLPKGFEERIRESKKGLLVKKWAPQLEILSHKSTGMFLSHCGWNSVLESLSQGVPIIGWPLAAEQAYNSKMMEEEMGVCVELARGIDGKIVSKEVKRVIEEVMGVEEEEGKGKEMRRKALVIAEKIRLAMREDNKQKGSSIKALDEFLGLFEHSKKT